MSMKMLDQGLINTATKKHKKLAGQHYPKVSNEISVDKNALRFCMSIWTVTKKVI